MDNCALISAFSDKKLMVKQVTPQSMEHFL